MLRQSWSGISVAADFNLNIYDTINDDDDDVVVVAADADCDRCGLAVTTTVVMGISKSPLGLNHA